MVQAFTFMSFHFKVFAVADDDAPTIVPPALAERPPMN
jgi:hypothetical protein